MSAVKLMCPKTHEVEFVGKATVDVKISYNVDEAGNVGTEIISVGEVALDEIKNLSTSKGKIKMENLVQAMQSDVSGTWHITDELVQAEVEDEENAGQTKTVIMTQAEYDAMSAPASIDDMNEDQAKAYAKQQQSDMEAMQAQMAAMQEQMKQMMAAMQGQQVPAQATTPAPAPAAKPAVETNIQMPVQTPAPTQAPAPAAQETPIDYADSNDGGNDFAGFDQGASNDDPFSEAEAPF